MNRRRFMLLVAAGAGAVAVELLERARRVDPVALRARADTIGRAHGIYIGYDGPETFFVAPWTSRDAVIPGDVITRVDLAAVPVALDGIEQALAVYPPGFVATRCKAVFICGSMTTDGVRAGGTYGPAWIILVASGRFGDGGIYETARLGIHHELSSFIWRGRLDLPSRWRTLLPAGHSEAKGNAEALKAGAGEGDVERGFLSPYGATMAENDFNTYAEIVFTEPARLAALADKHPLVAQKLALVIDAYVSFDSRFEDLFKKFGLDRFAQTHLPGIFEKPPS